MMAAAAGVVALRGSPSHEFFTCSQVGPYGHMLTCLGFDEHQALQKTSRTGRAHIATLRRDERVWADYRIQFLAEARLARELLAQIERDLRGSDFMPSNGMKSLNQHATFLMALDALQGEAGVRTFAHRRSALVRNMQAVENHHARFVADYKFVPSKREKAVFIALRVARISTQALMIFQTCSNHPYIVLLGMPIVAAKWIRAGMANGRQPGLTQQVTDMFRLPFRRESAREEMKDTVLGLIIPKVVVVVTTYVFPALSTAASYLQAAVMTPAMGLKLAEILPARMRYMISRFRC